MNWKNLFKNEDNITGATEIVADNQNPNSIKDGETYHHWGLRVCAIADGSHLTLVPYLHNVYHYIHQKQVKDENLQEQERQSLMGQIEQNRTEIALKNQKIGQCKLQQEEYKKKLDDLKKEKQELKNKAYEVNKEAKMKLMLGLGILIPLTFYLFLFYSSTFYSAFFKDFTTSDSVLNSMFDAEALSKALATSVTELCFILCAPIIFMGLGFSLHFFTIQKSWTKYIKMGSILCITFLFDAILAYMIGKHLHDMEVIMGILPLGDPYGLPEAIKDSNTWAVIFCGFIVYIIWGIVFDMSMSAYNQLDLNKINLHALDEKATTIEKELSDEKNKENTLNAEIAQVNKEILSLNAKINTKVFIDKAAIRTGMTEFFSGWVAQMSVLGKDQDEKLLAQEAFQKSIDSLL